MIIISLLAALVLWATVIATLWVGRVLAVLGLLTLGGLALGVANSALAHEHGVVLTSLLLLLTLAHLAVAAWHIWWAEGAQQWPTVLGVVLRTDVSEDSDGGVEHTPSVTYTYTVRGHKYTGTNWRCIPTTHAKRDAAEQAIRTYAPGTTTTVFYRSQNPATAVLVPAASWKHLLWCCIGAAQSLLAIPLGSTAWSGWTLFSCGLIWLAIVARPGMLRLPPAPPAISGLEPHPPLARGATHLR